MVGAIDGDMLREIVASGYQQEHHVFGNNKLVPKPDLKILLRVD